MPSRLRQTGLSLGIVGSVLSASALAIVTIFRNTPIVKCCDFSLTVLHLLTSLLVNIALLFGSFMKPTQLICYLDATGVGFLYTIFIACVLTKSHKLLRAFGSTRRLTSNNKRNTVIQQWIVISLVSLSSGAFVLLALTKQTPEITNTRDVEKVLIYVTCNTISHKTLQLGLAAVLQVATFIIAYRGRNLPNIFNESISLLYASFGSTMSFAVMFIVLRFSKKEDLFFPSSMIWLSISLNSNIYILLCYAKKILIILFEKEKNTRSYMQRKTFESNQEKVRQN